MSGDESAWLTVLAAILGGALRVSTPFLFVSLGEALTERAGRINLGLEGTMVFGAMSGYAIAYHSGSAWLGVLAAGSASMDVLPTIRWGDSGVGLWLAR